jgi:hypothetical protein
VTNTEEAITQPVDAGRLRLNHAVRNLMEVHELDMVSAYNLCCELERLLSRVWPLRFGMVIERTTMRVRDVRPWLLAHGYMTQRELDACERAA